MTAVSYRELASLDGELLPPRMLLSLVDVTFGNRSHDVSQPQDNGQGGGGPQTGGGLQPGASPQGGGGNTTVAYACQATTTQGTPGLIGSLGLGQGPSSSMTCVPAAVVSN
ncbi:hypothetical protein ABZ929_30685 [Streptomyces physcomitrii]|uniref:hypothetical protein n=1 Tax=Streptomyces physcomitrii TaxID=2724184 RepID=UPI0034378B38